MEEFIQKRVDEMAGVIDSADVLVVGFSRFAQRLLVDFRYNVEDDPMVRVVEPVNSVEERLRELRHTRARFSAPDRFTFFVWPRSLATFENLGLWERIVQKCADSGRDGVSEQCHNALRELLSLERREVMEAIVGNKYQSIWQRSV